MTGEYPHFVCIGPSKSATTWLADHLKLHRDMWFPPIQELSYLHLGFKRFQGSPLLGVRWDPWNVTKRLIRNKSLLVDQDREFFRITRELSEIDDQGLSVQNYVRLFSPAHGKISGDISPIYASFTLEQIEQIKPAIAHAKVFMFARDPVDRFWSHFSMGMRYRIYGEVDYSSREIVERFLRDPERSKQFYPSKILEKWQTALGEERFDVFYFNEVRHDPEKVLRQIVALVGGDYRKRIGLIPPSKNRKSANERLSPGTMVQKFVQDAFANELKRCAEVFGQYGRNWRDRNLRAD